MNTWDVVSGQVVRDLDSKTISKVSVEEVVRKLQVFEKCNRDKDLLIKGSAFSLEVSVS